MNRVCLTKSGKLIEMQGGGDDRPDLMEMRLNTLKQNALNAGYQEAEIEVKWVTDEEWVAIKEANKPIPTYVDLRRQEYPPVVDLADGLAKQTSSDPTISEEGHLQVAKYFFDCLAVKERYPKP